MEGQIQIAVPGKMFQDLAVIGSLGEGRALGSLYSLESHALKSACSPGPHSLVEALWRVVILRVDAGRTSIHR